MPPQKVDIPSIPRVEFVQQVGEWRQDRMEYWIELSNIARTTVYSCLGV